MFEPVIKWSGSKRSQAKEIISYFPKEINTYYEPFCGGCSVLRRLLDSDISVKNYICSDINPDLIALWVAIKEKPNEVSSHYKKLWTEMNDLAEIKERKAYFESVRESYNQTHNPLDFMFVMRTVVNGMPRYNKKGEFNSSFHLTRKGIIPQTLDKIINEWSNLLQKNNVQFVNCSYTNILPGKDDFMYLDPPYANTKGMYYGGIDNDELFNYLKNITCGYIMSYDGISGDIDNTFMVPQDVYDKHIYLKSGISHFKCMTGKSNNSMVYESLYIKEN